MTHFVYGLLSRFNNTNLTMHMKLLEHAKTVRGAELGQVNRFYFSIIFLLLYYYRTVHSPSSQNLTHIYGLYYECHFIYIYK